MVVDYQRLWAAFAELGLTEKNLSEMSKEEIDSLCQAVRWNSTGDGSEDVPFS